MSSPIFFDLIFLMILVLAFLYGKKQGAVRVVTGLFGTVAAWIIAQTLSPSVTMFTAKLITPYASSAISKAANSMGLTSILNTSTTITSSMASAASSILTLGDKLTALGVPAETASLASSLKVSRTLEAILPGSSGTLTPFDLLTQAMVRKIAPALTFFFIFFVIKCAITLISRLLSLNWPILSSLNHLAGGLFGLAGGMLIVLALTAGIMNFGTAEPSGITSYVLFSQSMTGRLLSSFFQ